MYKYQNHVNFAHRALYYDCNIRVLFIIFVLHICGMTKNENNHHKIFLNKK